MSGKTGDWTKVYPTFMSNDYLTFMFLDPSNHSRIPIFYLPPKIHKPGVPGRPIISG